MHNDSTPKTTDPHEMLLQFGSQYTDRKLRLFACTCASNVTTLLSTDELKMAAHKAIAAAFELADGSINQETAYVFRNQFRAVPGDFQWAAVAVACVLAAPEDFGEETALTLAGHTLLHVQQATRIGEPALTQASNSSNDARFCDLLRDIFGNPFRPVTLDPRWLTSTVLDLASLIYNDRQFERMPILADALMDAGCGSEEIIKHCQGPGPHVRGCWVVDLLLGKE